MVDGKTSSKKKKKKRDRYDLDSNAADWGGDESDSDASESEEEEDNTLEEPEKSMEEHQISQLKQRLKNASNMQYQDVAGENKLSIAKLFSSFGEVAAMLAMHFEDLHRCHSELVLRTCSCPLRGNTRSCYKVLSPCCCPVSAVLSKPHLTSILSSSSHRDHTMSH